MNDKTLVTIYNHDEEAIETITMKQFIKRFNNEQIDSTRFSIQTITYPTSTKEIT